MEKAIQAINAIDDWGGFDVPDHVRDAQMVALRSLMEARDKTDRSELEQ